MGILLSLLLSATLNAKTFETSYLKLNVPNSWQCQKIETIWTCIDPGQKIKEAFLVLTAKNVGPEDNLNNFQKTLSKTRVIQTSDGKTVSSKVNFTKKANYRGHEWIQALHQNSEILDYNTYYMSTVYENLAITISLSLYNQTQKKYSDIVPKIFSSIQLKKLNNVAQNSQESTNIAISPTGNKTAPTSGFSFKQLTSGDQGSYIYIIIALIVLGLIAFIFIRRR